MKYIEAFNEFVALSKIPRPSSHEEQIVEYLYNWAKEHNIEVYKDNYRNVVMKKPASKGYENYKPICLQAHTDMVCQAADGVIHDFLKDPIEVYVDGDIVSTKGKTTLGADNGLGVSSILAIFKDNSLKHPPLEAVLTSGEEEDFYGADNFDISILKSKYIINLDNSRENAITVGSAGGVTMDAIKKIKKDFINLENYKSYVIKISGLMGGHSGSDIHRGRGNSNTLLFRFLDKIREKDFYINDIIGGSFRLAIPRESSVKAYINKNDIDEILDIGCDFENVIRTEFPEYGENLKLEIKACDIKNNIIIEKSQILELIDYCLLSPVNIQIMSNSFEGLVDASCNLGEIFIKDENITVISDIRASYDSQREFILNKLIKLCKLFNFESKIYGYYYNWIYKKDSKLRDLTADIYEKNGIKPDIKTIHGGLEGGFFIHKNESIDIISIGPDAYDLHSPSEHFMMSSYVKFYGILCEILSEAKF